METDEYEVVGPPREDGADSPLDRARGVARRIDTQPSLLAAARNLRRRLPGDELFGDPLSTAGDEAVHAVARGVSALRRGRDSFVREVGLAGLQVWQSLSEATGRGRGDRAVALLFTDLVGFSSWALKAGDTVAVDLLRAVERAQQDAIGAHDGEIVKRLGDGLMAAFPSAQDAVEAALDAQDALGRIEIAGYQPRMRAGVHWGAPRRIGGEYLGVDVNIAQRVSDAAKAGDVLVSEAAAKLLVLDRLKLGRSKRLRAGGAPRDTYMQRVNRA
jgi:adenylate cyclase